MVSLSGRSEKARGLKAQNRERFEHSSRGTCSVPLLSALSSALPPYSHAEPSAPPVRPPSRALPLLPASPTSPAGPVSGLALKFRFRFPPAGPNDRQPRRRRCSRGCSPAPHPPGRRAATPWQVWGAGGVTWRRCRGLRPPREGRVRCAYGHRPEPADVPRSCCWNSGTAGTITSGHRSSRPALRLGGWQRQAWCSRGLLPPLPLRRAAAPLCVDPGRTRASCGLSERPVTPELHTARGQESPRQRSMEDVSPGEKPEEGRLKDSPCVVASELATARCHKHFPCKQDHRMAWVGRHPSISSPLP